MPATDFHAASPFPSQRAAMVCLGVLALYSATAGGSLATQDASAVFAQTQAIAERGAIDVPPEASLPIWRGADGRYHLPFGIGQALYNVPFYLAGKAAIRVTGIRVGSSDDTVLKASVVLGNAVAGALCAAVVFAFAWRLTGRIRPAVVAAALFAFGSPAWTYSKFGFNAMPAALMLSAGVYGVWTGVKLGRLAPVAWGGAALGCAMLTRHEMLLAGIACLFWTIGAARAQCRRRQGLVLAGTIGLAMVGWAWYNAARFGRPFETGHHPGFGAVGLLGLTVSPAASFLLYAPLTGIGIAVLVRVWRAGHSYGRLVVPVCAVLFAFYALLDDWIGTRSYGPRYLVPLLALTYAPLALMPVLRWRTRAKRFAAAVAVASVLVQLPGVIVSFASVGAVDGLPSANRQPFAWHSSPLLRNGAALAAAVPANLRYLTGAERPPSSAVASGGPGSAAVDFAGRLGFSLDFWWLYLFHLGTLTALQALGCGGALLLLAAGLLFSAGRPWREPASGSLYSV